MFRCPGGRDEGKSETEIYLVYADFDALLSDVGGGGEWQLPSDEIFELMKGIMESFSLPVVHQTVSEETLNDHHETVSRFKAAPGSWWNIEDIPHFGFLLLCSNVSQHLRRLRVEFPQDFKLPLRTYVDEGIANAGTSIALPNWGDVIESQKVLFCNSKDRAEI